LSGKTLNGGYAKAEAVVVDVPFSFIGDMNPDTGELTMTGHPLFGTVLRNKVLVIPTGRGGTIAPYIAYHAHKKGNAPAALLCNKADFLTLEAALTIDIPVMESFSADITRQIANGSIVEVNAEKGYITIC
jgi:Uncharacterized conserved protein